MKKTRVCIVVFEPPQKEFEIREAQFFLPTGGYRTMCFEALDRESVILETASQRLERLSLHSYPEHLMVFSIKKGVKVVAAAYDGQSGDQSEAEWISEGGFLDIEGVAVSEGGATLARLFVGVYRLFLRKRLTDFNAHQALMKGLE